MNITLNIPNTPPELLVTNSTQTVKKGDTLQTITINATKGDWLTWTHDLPSDWSVIVDDDTKSCTITPTSSSGLRSGTYTYTVTAANDKGTATQPITITIQGNNVDSSLLADDGAFTGTPQEPATSKTLSGQSTTTTETTFTDIYDRLMLSADIAITTASSDLAGIAGVPFTQRVSVDVTLQLEDPDYGIYAYSLDVEDLPEWLEISGELVSTDENLAEGITAYHHEFTLSGTPQTESAGVDVIFTATVNISGDTPILRAVGSKNVKIFAKESVLVSLDVSLSSEILTLNYGEGGTISPVLSVRGKYSDGSIRTLAPTEYSAEWSTASPDIEGLAFENGTLSVAASLAVGTYNFPVKASVRSADCDAAAEDIVRVIVNDVVPSGISADSTEVNASPSEAVNVHISLDAGTNVIWRISGDMPSGFSVTSADKALSISGIAVEADAGRVFTLTITASNSAGSVSKTITIAVLEIVPVISSGAVSWEVAEGAAFSQSITATGTNIVWRYSGKLPSGLSVSSGDKTFTVSGTPSTGSAGTYSLSVTASNTAGTSTATITLNVQAKPVLNATSLKWEGVIGEKFSQTISATGTNIVWRYSGRLPSGLNVSSGDKTFTVSGTPSTGSAGTYSLSVTASNSAGTSTATITLNVQAKPVLNASSLTWECVIGEKFSQTISATGTNIVWGYTGRLPSGLSVSSGDKTFTVSGTPSSGSAGTYSLSVTASNFAGTAEAEVALTVSESGATLQPKQDSPLTTTTTDGKSTTSTLTTFTDSTGSVLASIDVALTSASTDFSAVTGLMFSQTFSIDVALSLGIDDLSNYTYSLDIDGLPEWLKVSGEILSMDSEVKRTYHHEFVLSGKPSASEAANILFTAAVKVSGDTSIIEALGRKDVKISVSPASVLALNAEISCDSLSLDEGSSVKFSPLLTVRADLTDGSSTYLASHDYSFSWSTSSTDVRGITFADGVLTVGTDALVGTYSFPVSATVKHGKLEVSASKNIIINVNRRESSAQKSSASIDIEITTASNAFSLNAGQNFAQTVSIDVEVRIVGTDYNAYAFWADISGLPDWLKTDGETARSSALTARKYHHEFRIYGTAPENSASVNAIISVNAELSGGAESLRASASKDVHISVNAVSPQPESSAPSSPSSPDSQNNAELPDATPNSSENKPSTDDNSLPDSEPPTEDNSLPNHDSPTENTLIPPPY